jgi:hypothetical protein
MWHYEIIAEAEKVAMVTVKVTDEDETYTTIRVFTEEAKFRKYLAFCENKSNREITGITSKCVKCSGPATSAVKVDAVETVLFCETHRVADHARRVKISKEVQRESIERALSISRGNVMLNGRR